MNERRMIGIAALALGSMTCFAGCPGAPPAAEPPTSTIDTGGGSGGSGGGACGDVETMLAESCGRCHDADQPAKGLDLVSPGLAARVVGQPSQAPCGGLLADPEHPEASVLYDKLLETPGCGARMPIGAAPLSADEIACVRAWIAAQ